MRGRQLIAMDAPLPDALQNLDASQRSVFTHLYPWITEPMVPSEPRAVLDGDLTSDEGARETAEQAAEQYDLDPEDAAFLEQLLGED